MTDVSLVRPCHRCGTTDYDDAGHPFEPVCDPCFLILTGQLTGKEARVYHASLELVSALRSLIGDGPAAEGDWAEAASHIHALQAWLTLSIANRTIPGFFRAPGGSDA